MSAAAAPANGAPAKPATGAGAGAGNGGAPRTVPWERFQTVTAEKNALAEEIKGLRAEVQTATERAATADTLAEQLRQAKEAHAAAQAGWGEERALLGAGVTDPEDADLVRHYYGKVPAEGKPATIGDYLATLRAEGAVVPKGLAHVFAPKVDAGAGAGAGAVAGAGAGAGGKPPPKPSTGAGSSATPGTYTGEQIQAMRREAARTGNVKPLQEAMAALEASMKKK